jgi:uncharacterized phage protein (TIGR02218 family)
MKTLPPALATHIAGGLTTLCRCWRVDRRDGVVMGFTDFDAVTYKAASGFTATAIEGQLGLAVSNLDVQGALSSLALSEADLSAGRYDDATVTIYLVNWTDVGDRALLRRGNLGNVSRGRTAFSAELRGLAAKLDQTAGRIFQRSCAWTLGDARCGVNLNTSARRATGSVLAVLDAFTLKVSGLAGITTGELARGKLEWTSGANAGLAIEVAADAVQGSSKIVTLALPMGRPIVAGDAFVATVGCDHSVGMCQARFSNVVNFGGFPHVPGTDFALFYPNKGDNNDGGRL